MKRLLLAFALILCLVLCVFCFASCGKKDNAATTAGTAAPGTTAANTAATTASATTVPQTTVPQTTVPHVHTPGPYEVVTPATCSAAGEEAQYCTECGERIEESLRPIPINPDAHSIVWDVTPATMFADGHQEGRCTLCGREFEEVLTFEPQILKVEELSSNIYGMASADTADEILKGGKHFYPTDENLEGNDLFIEFSILWNHTHVDNLDGYMITGIFSSNYKNSVKTTWMALNPGCGDCWCPYAGGFETSDLGKIEEGPSTMGASPAANGTFADYPNFTGASADNVEWGWHRITIRVHQALINEDALKADETAGATKAQYKLSGTVYFDGVKAFELSYTGTGDSEDVNGCKYWGVNMAKGLYSATSDGQGGVTYTDDSRGLPMWGVAINAKAKAAGAPGYVVYGDVRFTCGKAPAMPVKRVETPASATYEIEEGVTVPSTTYFEINCTEHVWDGYFKTTKAASLLENGAKVEHCSICGAEHEVAVEYEPTIKAWTDASSGEFDYGKKKVVNEVLNGDHFYPSEDNANGKDLLVEYSILWNESMLNFLGGSANPWIHTFVGKESADQYNNIAYWSPVADNNNADCKFAGGFEYGTMRTSEEGNPYPQMTKPVGDSIDEFPNIGGVNGGDGTPQGEPQWGWHRVQIRLHIDVTNADALKADTTAGATKAEYKCISTIYIDGVLVSILSSTSMTNNSNAYDNKLFTAASDGQGGIAYTDIAADKWVHPIRFNSTKAKTGTTVYVVIGDVSVTCGTEFVQNVEKVATPAAATIEVATGVNISAAMYYKAK